VDHVPQKFTYVFQVTLSCVTKIIFLHLYPSHTKLKKRRASRLYVLGGWDGVANMRFSSVEVLGTGFFVSFLVGLRNGG